MPEELFDADFRRKLERLRLLCLKSTARRRGIDEGAIAARATHRQGAPVEPGGHRDYVPGDDVRYVDWNASGRLDRIIVREFEGAAGTGLRLVLDCTRSMAFGLPDKFAFARRLAAVFAYVALHSGESVVVETFPSARGSGGGAFGPIRGAPRFGSLMRYLEEMDVPAARPEVVEDAFAWGADRRACGTVVFFSDLWEADRILPALVAAGGRTGASDLAIVQVLARNEMTAELDGPVQLEDSESGGTVRLDVDEAVAAGHAAELDAFLKRVESACARFSIRHTLLPSDTPLDEAILRFVRSGYFAA